LAPDGLFLFDLNTAEFYHRLQSTPLVQDSDGELLICRASGFSEPGGICHLDLDRFRREDGSCWHRQSYRHSFRHHVPQRTVTQLADTGLDTLGIHGLRQGVLRDTWDEETDRKVIYACRKPAPVVG